MCLILLDLALLAATMHAWIFLGRWYVLAALAGMRITVGGTLTFTIPCLARRVPLEPL